MLNKTRERAYKHAQKEYPRESCGLIVIRKGRELYVPCRNIARAEDQFIIDPNDYDEAESKGQILAVVHSHPNAEPYPSQADRVSCEASGLPWFIVSYPKGLWFCFEPCGYEAPLVGREWSYGVLDCYTLVKDWYAAAGVKLNDYERTDFWWEYGKSMYIDHYAEEGFISVKDEPERGDVLLMAVNSKVPNHAAIFLGDGMILHHYRNRLSSRDLYNGFWQKHTTHVMRYEEWYQ